MTRKCIALTIALLVLAGCGPREDTEETPIISTSPNIEYVEPEEEVWSAEDTPRMEPLTEIDIDDGDVDYQVVEVQRSRLFTVERDGLEGANWYLVDGNVVIDYQQENIVVLDWSGGELARIPTRGKGVGFSEKHFAVVDYDVDTITVYSGMKGEEIGQVSIADVTGTVQGVSVRDDGEWVAFTSDPMENTYLLYEADLQTGEVVRLEPELTDGVSLGYGIQYIAEGSMLAVDGGSEDTAYIVYLDADTGELLKQVPIPAGGEQVGDQYVMPRVLTSHSGLIYHVANEYDLQMAMPFLSGDRLNGLYRTNDCGGVWRQHLPLTGQGRAGFFPLYDFITIGALDDDNMLVAYFDSGQYQVEQITLGRRFTESPEGGIDLSREGLDVIIGQRLYHRFGGGSSDTYRLLSSIVTQYVDAFGSKGYLLDNDDPKLADDLYWFTLLNNYGIEGGVTVRLEKYYSEEEGLYRIPADLVERWVLETFQMDDLEVDVRSADIYDAATDSFTYGPGFGMGETDTVYIEAADFGEDGMLDLTVVVIPSHYAAVQEGREQVERLHMVVYYHQERNTFAYQLIELLDQ